MELSATFDLIVFEHKTYFDGDFGLYEFFRADGDEYGSPGSRRHAMEMLHTIANDPAHQRAVERADAFLAQRIVGSTTYSQMLLSLRMAQYASDAEKIRSGMEYHRLQGYQDRRVVGAHDLYVRMDGTIGNIGWDGGYAQKEDALAKAADLAHAAGVSFGWRKDDDGHAADWVCYFDLPEGQVSFHAKERGAGPDYSSAWSGERDTLSILNRAIESVAADIKVEPGQVQSRQIDPVETYGELR